MYGVLGSSGGLGALGLGFRGREFGAWMVTTCFVGGASRQSSGGQGGFQDQQPMQNVLGLAEGERVKDMSQSVNS